MKRFVVLVAGVVTVIGVGACASLAIATVSFTSSESMVAGCQKVADIAAKTEAKADAIAELGDQARSKGANYVLRASDDARTGTAYRCEAPRVASH